MSTLSPVNTLSRQGEDQSGNGCHLPASTAATNIDVWCYFWWEGDRDGRIKTKKRAKEQNNGRKGGRVRGREGGRLERERR